MSLKATRSSSVPDFNPVYPLDYLLASNTLLDRLKQWVQSRIPDKITVKEIQGATLAVGRCLVYLQGPKIQAWKDFPEKGSSMGTDSDTWTQVQSPRNEGHCSLDLVSEVWFAHHQPRLRHRKAGNVSRPGTHWTLFLSSYLRR